MKKLAIILFFTCTWVYSHAQVNFILNPSFERYDTCPTQINQINHAKFWNCAVDTLGEPYFAPEYYNTCAGTSPQVGIPENIGGAQFPRTGNGMIGGTFYYDKTLPRPAGVPFNERDYAQGHLSKALTVGKSYCVTFWVNLGEVAGYAQNKLGAYLDDGTVNIPVDTPGNEITDVIPQVYTDSIITDTANWVKIEGSFVATGNETHITLGNFFKNAVVDTINYLTGVFTKWSYYYIDDVSVIETDLKADAGVDTWVEVSKVVKIGRVGDSTVSGLNCHWYHKGMLIDSGAIISVHAAATKGIVDTYVVVQTICGIVTTDTVTVWTVGLGITSPSPLERDGVRVYPNPSDGNIVITKNEANNKAISLKVFDLLGRVMQQQQLTFTNNQSSLKIDEPTGTYILELQDSEGNVSRERIIIH
jgi:hypothetical protein